MPKPDRSAIQFDDGESHRLHLVWSRSGKHLIVTVATERWEDWHQVELSPEQVFALIAFLTETVAHSTKDR